MRRLDRKVICARTEVEIERLEPAVGDAAGAKSEAGEERRGQRAGVGAGVRSVIERESVGRAAFAIDGQRTEDRVEGAAAVGGDGCRAADVDRIAIAPRVDGGVAAGRLDRDAIGTVIHVEDGDARVRRLNREGVGTGTEADVQRFDRVRSELEALGGIAARHAEPGEPRRGEQPRIGRSIAAVIEVDRVRRTLPVDDELARDGVDVAAGGGGIAADVDRVRSRASTGIDGRQRATVGALDV